MPKQIGLVNVAYSPNLGDGIIAECLSALLKQRFGCVVRNVDIAGRKGFGPAPRRTLALKILGALPPVGRRAGVRLALAAKHVREDAPLAGPAELVLVGGGQLLQDDDLNFPLKLRRVLDVAAARGIPVAIVSAGVAGRWSRSGLQIVRGALGRCRVLGVGLRDPGSMTNWNEQFGDLGLPAPLLCPDPAIGVASILPDLRPAAARGRTRVGLNVTHPMLLARHSHDRPASIREAAETWKALARALESKDRRPVFFTNGAPEDERFLDEVMAGLGPDTKAERLPRASHPLELVRTIAGLDALLAHRLHAAIVGVSFDVPVIGFKWDDKLVSFFEFAGLGDFAMDFHETPVDDIVAAADRSAQPRYDAVRARMREKSESLLIDFLAAIVGRGEGAGSRPASAHHAG